MSTKKKCKEIQEAILEVSDNWSGDDNSAKRKEVREKISKSHEENPRITNFEFVDELGHNVRSNWEKEVGLLLSRNNIEYTYEGEKIKLSKGIRYIPDFILDEYVIEVKGRVHDYAIKKAKLLMEKDSREYVVIGTEMPCDIHIEYANREEIIEIAE